MRQFGKSEILQRLQPLQNGQFGTKIKNAKHMRKTILQEHQSCSVQKKPLENTQNIPEMRQFGKPAILQSPCKGYSLCKLVTLGQKLKMPKTCEKPFYRNIRVVLCKKPLKNTPNIPKMRQFEKLAILQRLQPMQRLQLLQNGHFGSKIKKGQKHTKNYSTRTLELFCAKTARKKKIPEMRQF